MNRASGWSIRPFEAGDGPALTALLDASGLPTGDLQGRDLPGFLVARDDHAVLGVAGVEASGEAGLLRSVAVAPAARGSGLGAALVAAAEASALQGGTRTLYLLTTTAPDFFARLGYERIGRDQAPPDIAASAEFARLCPASAVCMRKYLADSGDRGG